MTITGNLTQAIWNGTLNTVGTLPFANYEFALVGVLILVVFAYWIFTSKLGVTGLLLILPLLILLLSSGGKSGNGLVSGFIGVFPSWVGVLIWVIIVIYVMSLDY